MDIPQPERTLSTRVPLWLLDPELFGRSEKDVKKKQEELHDELRKKHRLEEKARRRLERRRLRKQQKAYAAQNTTSQSSGSGGRRLRTKTLVDDTFYLGVERAKFGGLEEVEEFPVSVPVSQTDHPKFNCLCTHQCETRTCETDYMCHVVTRKGQNGGPPETSYGCLTHDIDFLHLALCEGGREGNSDRTIIRSYCCEGEMCNQISPPELQPTTSQVTQESPFSTNIGGIHPGILIAVPAALFLILFILILLMIKQKRSNTREQRRQREIAKHYHGDNLSAQPLTVEDSSMEFPEQTTSGSGSGGQPPLIQRTVAKSVTLAEQIGTGKYGNVHKGIYQGGYVAVKVFLSKDLASWERENDIYTTLLLRHENILGFIASDITSSNSVTQFWLMTHYHKHGSLYDYLNDPYHVITVSQAVRMLHSACAGLLHLHNGICAQQNKPSIAHRDIKSKNILVKDDGTCCIADLGLAVTHKGDTLDMGHNHRVGTKRYMAPEVLNDSIAAHNFESFKQADVYSFSLVIWETMYCSLNNGYRWKYQMPYEKMVPGDPSFDEMRNVVQIQKRRPIIPHSWSDNQVLSSTGRLLQECWNGNPVSRLPMLRIKKKLTEILEECQEEKAYL